MLLHCASLVWWARFKTVRISASNKEEKDMSHTLKQQDCGNGTISMGLGGSQTAGEALESRSFTPTPNLECINKTSLVTEFKLRMFVI